MPTPDVISQQTDWPNPRGQSRLVEHHAQRPLALNGADRFFGAPGESQTYDWPNPRGPLYPVALRTHLNPVNLNLRSQDSFPPGLPNLHEWPNPTHPRWWTAVNTMMEVRWRGVLPGGGAQPVANRRGYWPDPIRPVWSRFLADPGYFPAVFITPVPPPVPPPTPPTIAQTIYATVFSNFQPSFGAVPQVFIAPSAQRMLIGTAAGRQVFALPTVGVLLVFNLAPVLGATRQISNAAMTLTEETGIDLAPQDRMFGAPAIVAGSGYPARQAQQILSGLLSGGVYVATLTAGFTDGSTKTFAAAFMVA